MTGLALIALAAHLSDEAGSLAVGRVADLFAVKLR